MINIAICDDEIYERENLKGILNGIALKNNMEVKIEQFRTGEELLNTYVRGVPKYNIIFLDIVLGDSNGIEIAKKILSLNNAARFIILSSSKEYILDGYDISAINYILKPAKTDKIEKEFLRAIQIEGNDKNIYEVKKSGNVILINLRDIFYFEVNHRKITIHEKESNIEFYEKLDFVEETIKNKGFVRCHKSYMVSLSKIKELKGKELILKNNLGIPIGRKYKEKVKEEFFKYLKLI